MTSRKLTTSSPNNIIRIPTLALISPSSKRSQEHTTFCLSLTIARNMINIETSDSRVINTKHTLHQTQEINGGITQQAHNTKTTKRIVDKNIRGMLTTGNLSMKELEKLQNKREEIEKSSNKSTMSSLEIDSDRNEARSIEASMISSLISTDNITSSREGMNQTSKNRDHLHSEIRSTMRCRTLHSRSSSTCSF